METNQKILREILKEQKEFRESLTNLDIKFDQRYKEQDKRFDKRFDKIDKRFEKIDKKFEEQSKKFDLKLEKEIQKQGKEFQNHISILMEDIDGKIRLIAEQYEDIRKTLDSHTEMIATMKEDIEIIKGSLRIIRNEVNNKAELNKFQILEKRVAVLEEKVAAR